jgi:L-ascorbate metabolism protein UlaG (beta-lactamase superfamily)
VLVTVFLFLVPALVLADDGSRVAVEYIAHSAFRLEAADGTAIVIDPYADRVWLSYDFPGGIEAEAWLVSHPHYDHDGGEYRGSEPAWPPGAKVLRFPGEFEVGPFRILGIAGRHAEPYGEEFGRFNTVWRVEVSGITIVHWGDNEPLNETLVDLLSDVDILMLPIDGTEHLISFFAVDEIVARLEPEILIPMHYRLPDLEPSPDRPKNLGPIDPWLIDRDGVVRLETNRLEISKGDLPATGTQIRVLRHSPLVYPPTDD